MGAVSNTTIEMITILSNYTAREVMLAHQYLYYVGPTVGLSNIWTDRQYDKWCKANGLDGNGGSDNPSDYSMRVVALARKMHENRFDYPFDLEVG